MHETVINVAVLPGDGIGQAVMRAAVPVLKLFNLPIQLHYGEIGWSCWKQAGTPIPSETWTLIRQSDAILLGAITSQPEREALNALPIELQKNPPKYQSPILQLRQALELYANVRPCFRVSEVGNQFNFCIIRENTEGLYSGFDYHPAPPELYALLDQHECWRDRPREEISCSIRLQSKQGLLRIFKFAFQYAEMHGMGRVTFADKPNVLRESSAYARVLFEAVASDYPDIQADILNVDAVALWLIKRPESFGVIVAENMFGDILSDVSAGVMGGLGLAPSANIGAHQCYFEPVHGSAPRMAPESANPSAMFLSIALMLDHLGYSKEATMIRGAVVEVIRAGAVVTYDLGGSSTTDEMASAILEACYGRAREAT